MTFLEDIFKEGERRYRKEKLEVISNKKGGKLHLFCPKSTMNLTYLCYGFVKVDIILCLSDLFR